jgi:hypothetical protein
MFGPRCSRAPSTTSLRGPFHRLEHVQRLAAADLADDDPVRAHPQRVAHEIADGDLALTLDVRRPRLEGDHVGFRQPQLGGVLDRDESFVVGDRRGEDPEHRGLPAARAAAHDDVGATTNAREQEPHRARPDRTALDEPGRRDRCRRELADGECWTAEREGRHDRVNRANAGTADARVPSGLTLKESVAELKACAEEGDTCQKRNRAVSCEAINDHRDSERSSSKD